MSRVASRALQALLISVLLSAELLGEPGGKQWPCFRGIQASGVLDGVDIPTTWDVKTGTNVRWKAPIAGLGLSSPVVWGERVFLTTAVSSDTKSNELKVGLYGDPTSVYEKKKAEYSWRVLCLDRKSGKVLWDREACQGVPKIRRHPKASHANSTPATDGKHLVAFFGSEGLYCYDMEGNLLWKKEFGVLNSGAYDDVELQWGFGSSPIIDDGRLIIQCDVQDEQFLAMFDVKDGREIWRTPRKDVCSWSTPTVLKTDDRAQIICNGYRHIGGYDYATGKELWSTRGGGDVPVCTPIISNGLIFITNAHGPLAPIYAIDPSATGKIPTPSDSASNRYISWYSARGGNYMQTPIALGEHVYFCRDNGVLTCYAATTGEKLYSERLGKGTTGFTGSPVASDGHIFYTSEEGDVFVIKAGPTFELMAQNSLGELSMATPAVSDGLLLIRGNHHLFAIGPTANNAPTH